MNVFDVFQREDERFKRNRESNFQFYNRSSRNEIAQIRERIESYVLRYPKEEVAELISRIRSGNDINFKSAIFELILHEALLKKNFRLYPHPDLPNGNDSKPDFLVVTPEGDEFYLEAVLATENNELNEGAEARKGLVFDTLSSNPHQNFIIFIDDEGSPDSQPSGNRLSREIHQWLNSLDPDEVQSNIDARGLNSVEPFEWYHENWSIKFRPIPLKPSRRGESTNLIGISGMGGGWRNAWSPLRDAIKFKGNKYGLLDKPLLIAVNLNSFHLDRIDEMQALFGQENIVFEIENPDSEPRIERSPNGAWVGLGGPQYTRVSGAWLFNNLHIAALHSSNQTIYFNPWANNILPESMKCFPHAISDNNEMNWVEGLSFAEILEV